MNSVLIDLGPRSYPIHIGSGLLGQSGLLAPLVQGRQILVVTNEVVAPLYLDTLLQGLAEVRSECVILPDGEQHKNLDTLNLLFDALLRQHYGRDCVVIALGGGVVGDIAGFGAACYQRGVRVVQVPTTLLAQVDSAVGGKTAVNHALGKNMIGVFHQPACVICDTLTLRTLDERQLRAGLAEVIKYGLIGDLEFFEWIETRLAALLAREEDVLAEAVRRSCENKAAVVAADERESGVRALLNLGHTFGHAIETGLGYGVWLHGEAVAAGICLAADLSARLGWLAQADVARIVSVLARAGLPTHAPAALSPEHMLELMGVDKKRQHGRLRLVLLERVGHGVLTDAFDPAALTMTLEHCREAA